MADAGATGMKLVTLDGGKRSTIVFLFERRFLLRHHIAFVLFTQPGMFIRSVWIFVYIRTIAGSFFFCKNPLSCGKILRFFVVVYFFLPHANL